MPLFDDSNTNEGVHIPLAMLWEVRTQVRLFSDKKIAHFVICDRCISVWGICQVSRSIEEAERRLKEHGLVA